MKRGIKDKLCLLYLDVASAGLTGGAFFLLMVGLPMRFLKPKLSDDAGIVDILVRFLETPLWIVLPCPLLFLLEKKIEKDLGIEKVGKLCRRFKSDGFCTTDIISGKSIERLEMAVMWVAGLSGLFLPALLL